MGMDAVKRDEDAAVVKIYSSCMKTKAQVILEKEKE